MSSSEGHELATALDDIIDLAEEAADTLGTYHVEAPMEQSVAMADVLVGAGEQIANALRALRSGTELAPHLVEIHRLENEGDRIGRAAIASLFATHRPDGRHPLEGHLRGTRRQRSMRASASRTSSRGSRAASPLTGAASISGWPHFQQ